MRLRALVAVFLVISVCEVAGIGNDLKTLFSMLGDRCESGQTSCETQSGLSCCQFPLGVCCDGGQSCCPLGFSCADNECVSKYGRSEAIPTTRLTAQRTDLGMDISLPESKTTNSTCTTKTCNSEQTCCHDDWDCCPEPEAVCCKDKGHCCPKGYICDDQPMICRWPDDDHQVKTIQYIEKPVLWVVKCDDEHECPDSNTCCEMADGSWGCCPVAEATCCDDHIHCCAKGSTCDTKHGRCDSKSGMMSVPWVTKTSAKKTKIEVKAVQCDFTHECQTGSTCCKLANGQWGCCPVPNAVCCADHVHCCPNGYTCQSGTGECTRGMSSIPWLTKDVAVKSGNVEAVQCDSTHQCPSGNTCCKLAGGQWGCCPVPNAVCCADRVHCCPSGNTCQSGTGECIRGMSSIPWLTKDVAVRSDNVEAVQCDSTHECPTGNTCCKLADGQWGCCPVPNAVCCTDHVHCCPNGYTCQSGTGECTRGMSSIPWLTKDVAVRSDNVEAVQCDSTHQCPSGNTCCKLAGGQWGCCPVPNAVCCADRVHCCPSGNTCQSGTGKCIRGMSSIPWLTKDVAVRSDNVEAVQCDSTHECPTGNTCCKLAGGQWGCCPVPNAVCCADRVHCCPNGYTCQSGTGECTRGMSSIPWLTKDVAVKSDNVEAVQCDSTHQCPSGNTCCKLAGGQWGCCPVPNAVCCADRIHCCPSGNTCQSGTGECIRGMSSIPWLTKDVAVRSDNVEAVQCDSTHECPTGNTCCKLAGGQWGCCPVPNAVCCADRVHCCPNGYTCQSGTGECTRGMSSIPWLTKDVAVKSDNVEAVQCDSTHQCPSGNTCCKLAGGQWGCCPVPNAVCCADRIHCCPSGNTCQSGTGECIRGMSSIPWLTKEVAVRSDNVEAVQCDSTHECPTGNTCCKLAGGQWGCCPVPNAVCCADHVHCCPNGYTCQSGTGECTRGMSSIPWLTKDVAVKSDNVEAVQCDSTHHCPSGNTCCKLAGGQWGCCPVPNAVCCADRVHCCPSGNTCQSGTGECIRGMSSIPWLTKEVAVRSDNVEAVQCDSTHECPTGNTCCKLADGQWGCCPVPNAVCCADHVHCCPNGYTCQSGTGECIRGMSSIPWLTKEVAVRSDNVEAVQCDSTHECPTGNTCCKLADGQWGCCPVPNAVCCADHVHCCPNGYTCQSGTGECIRGMSSIPWLTKEVAVRSDNVEAVQCDSTHECPTGNTCCKLADGQWGCCPVPNAVCCADHVHCCPNGYTCQSGTGECTRGMSSIPWLTKDVAVKSDNVEAVQCDSTHHCPSGNTCCKLAGGQWGCCPVPNAVCCADRVHCCPSGNTCQSGTGECIRGMSSIPWLTKDVAVRSDNVEAVQCDSTHECPTGNTCCKLADGQWGCCPVPNAVCCTDHVHCCPNGYTCQSGTGECTRGMSSIPWLTKDVAVRSDNVEAVQCDSTHQCPSGNTCCKLAGGQWGCCPVPNAVCCADRVHCCPSGNTCQSGTGECIRGMSSIPWLTKEVAVRSDNVEAVQCDSTHECPTGNTCCKLADGQWGCCPVPNAVCCADHVHCCPNGYTCQSGTGECSKGYDIISWLTRKPAKAIAVLKPEQRVQYVKCDDEFECPDSYTCCRMSSGNWGCCPYSNAVCCGDGLHCCPAGYTCDSRSQRCYQRHGSTTKFRQMITAGRSNI